MNYVFLLRIVCLVFFSSIHPQEIYRTCIYLKAVAQRNTLKQCMYDKKIKNYFSQHAKVMVDPEKYHMSLIYINTPAECWYPKTDQLIEWTVKNTFKKLQDTHLELSFEKYDTLGHFFVARYSQEDYKQFRASLGAALRFILPDSEIVYGDKHIPHISLLRIAKNSPKNALNTISQRATMLYRTAPVRLQKNTNVHIATKEIIKKPSY